MASIIHINSISPIIVLLLLFLSPYPVSSFSLEEWLNDPPYGTGSPLQDEIQCYGLPYGGIGFLSHILTYWTLAWISIGRSPWWPWRVNDAWLFDMIFAIVGLISAVVLSVLTILRCRNRWEFIAIAVWKLLMSVTLGALSTHAATVVRKWIRAYREADPNYNGPYEAADASKTLWWLVLYVPGVIGGLVGLFPLVVMTIDSNQTVETVTIVFASVAAGGTALLSVMAWLGNRGKSAFTAFAGFFTFLILFCITIGMLAAFYSDWVLGAIAGNIVGVPSSDNAPLYWGYFLAKRLPFFSF